MLISFKTKWCDLLAVQGTFKSLLQHHTSILWHSDFFLVQLSYLYMTTGKTIALTIWTFLLLTQSSFVIAFLPKSNYLVISWLQSPYTVILEPKKRKSVTSSTFSPSICHKVIKLDAMNLVFFLILSFKPTFSLSSLTLIKRFFSSSSLPAARVVSSAYLRLLIFLLAILIPACASFSSYQSLLDLTVILS